MASAFERYLRTGRRTSPAAELEAKFNPWHDPEDGRFTFPGQGRYFPSSHRSQTRRESRAFGGRGGSFGGGGAGGSWSQSPRPAPSQPLPSATRNRATVRSTFARPEQGRPADGPRLTIRKKGYEFLVDAHARTRRVTGEIRLQLQSRSRRAQVNAGKPDRRNTDDGGHYIAACFNGPREWFNHFAQDANFNRGSYRALEDQWAKAVRSGKRVFVDITPHYHGTSMRPHKLFVRWIIDGKESSQDFPNEKRSR